MCFAFSDGAHDRICRGVDDMMMADLGHRCAFAAPHAGRSDQAYLAAVEAPLQGIIERVRTEHLASQTVAHADRQGRRRRIAIGQHIEMGVEGGDLIDFRQGQLHLLG